MQRKLTVILSADVVGYSSLMERDEAGTHAHLKANRTNIFDRHVAAHGGRIFKLMGDGALVEFTSIVSAIHCAQEIQEATDAEVDQAGVERLRYRIGVNLGEVIVEGDDIYGEGVNIAARLQALAEPGGMAVSRTVRELVRGKVRVEFEDLGEHTVKNIERPIHVFASRGTTTRPTPPAGTAPSPNSGPSICVLPLVNMSGDPEQEYFSDGITEDIITDLSKISALSVISRNTSFMFKSKQFSTGQVARQLNVSHVLEGSVRKSGNRVRITAQLIEGATDNHLWAERYDRDLNDIFSVQDEIAEAIAKALKLKLLPSEKVAIEQRSTTNPEAYKLYLMARRFNATGNSRHRSISIRLCEQAVKIDPTYARAWALLAICKTNSVMLTGAAGDLGWTAAERALALDPGLAEAHAAKGRILADDGRFDEASAEHAIALGLDPESYEVNAAAARCFMSMKRHDEAIQCHERAAAAIETDFWALGMSITCHHAKGDIDGERSAARRALERIEKLIVAEPDHGYALSFGVTALASLGDAERAKEWVKSAILLDPDNTVLCYNLGCTMVKLGEFEEALRLLEKCFRALRPQSFKYIDTDSDLDPIRNDPRYQTLIAEAKARHA